MDKFVARGLTGAALLAGLGIFYHYVIYEPALQRDRETKEAAAVERAEALQKEKANKYAVCVDVARVNYDSNWAEACKNVAAENTRDFKNCLATPSIMSNPYMGAQWCQQQYGAIDPQPNCTLPGKRAEQINQYFADSKAQCEREAKLGM